MLIADLKTMAAGMGISGSGSMKKAQLIEAIKTAQTARASSAASASPASPERSASSRSRRGAASQTGEAGQTGETGQPEEPAARSGRQRRGRKASAPPSATDEAGSARPADTQSAVVEGTPTESAQTETSAESRPRQQRRARQQKQAAAETTAGDQAAAAQSGSGQGGSGQTRAAGNQNARNGQGKAAQSPARNDQARNDQARNDQARNDQARNDQAKSAANEEAKNEAAEADDADGESGGRRNRRRRGRERDRTRNGRNEPDTMILEDDVLVPAAGILDVLENYAFVRTSGYLPGADDVYVSLSLVKRLGLRRGDAVVGQVRQPREGERREKYNPMVRIDSVNGVDPESAKHRAEFAKLTPIHPQDRLRLESGPENLTGRLIDLVAPIGKGQRGLIVSPGDAGKTTLLQQVAGAVTSNNPECHLMVVLVGERPEEVTDFERSVKGEVISSTFDRAPADHTIVAELAIERAKRLVELGHDVVVLLDGITRLGRAYNLAAQGHASAGSAPVAGRALAGTVDSAALYPSKRFFGAARNVENGGSLTILATAQVESGSVTDELILEEFDGTGNAELRLRREYAEKRIFPALDPIASGTRYEEQLIGEAELALLRKVRRAVAELGAEEGLVRLLARLRATHTNVEFLTRVQQVADDAVL
ncbi:MAG: transcription termination factor Rho [Nocardioides sp.]